ncbi:hypothetical protein GE09DRAFT_1062107 [Coniochaeta sp. 2T2.1]|nr:hypothetical protein GE09DRAFT_1062107 [Coniochaeta sp. 2T2.1]
MSSQDNKGIPLSHAPNHVSYKLFELPPELLDLLEGDNSPVSLTLTSSPTAALLKTPNKTYSLRQKNTSNALILLSPSATNPNPTTSTSTATTDTTTHTSPMQEDTEVEGMPDTTPGLNAIATVHETIELVPQGDNAAAPAKVAKGKWHERFAKGR